MFLITLMIGGLMAIIENWDFNDGGGWDGTDFGLRFLSCFGRLGFGLGR